MSKNKPNEHSLQLSLFDDFIVIDPSKESLAEEAFDDIFSENVNTSKIIPRTFDLYYDDLVLESPSYDSAAFIDSIYSDDYMYDVDQSYLH